MNMFKHLLLATVLIVTSGALLAQEENTPVEPLSQAELEQILAPIALYPDTVLSHILVAATYPLEVIQAERWTVKHPDLNGSEAVEAVNDKDWDPSVRALVAFPQILKRLSEDLEWTQRLGEAFLRDEEQLLASVQSLRQRAYKAGNLDDLDKLSVAHEDNTIVIEPREREVVYVPYYDTRTVYGPWAWAQYPPVYWSYPYNDHHYAGHNYSPFYWGPRTHISFGFSFSSLHWGNHHVVRIPYNHYSPRNYYNHHQILRHHQARRWAHSPYHRRGVGYQNRQISKRYPLQHYNTRNYGPKHYDQGNYKRGDYNERNYNPKQFNNSSSRINVYPSRNTVNTRNVVRTSPNSTASRVLRENQSRPAGVPGQQRATNNSQNYRQPNQVRSNRAPSRPAVVANTSPRSAPVQNQRSAAPPVQHTSPRQNKSQQAEARQQYEQAKSNSPRSNPSQGRVRTQPR